MLNENFDVFFSDFAVVGTVAGREFSVVFDKAENPFQFEAEGRAIIATAKTSDVENLHHGDTIIIEFISYQIVGIRPIMDGKITELDLKE